MLFWQYNNLFDDIEQDTIANRKKICFDIMKCINDKQIVTISEILNFLGEKYDLKTLNTPELRKAIKECFHPNEKHLYTLDVLYGLFDADVFLVENYLNREIEKGCYNRQKTIEEFLNCEFSHKESNTMFEKRLSFVISAEKGEINRYRLYKILYFEGLCEKEEICFNLSHNRWYFFKDELIKSINEKYHSFLVEDVFKNDIYVQLLNSINVFTINDWINSENEKLDTINSVFYDYFINDAQVISDLFESGFVDKINACFDNLKESYKNIMYLKYGISDGILEEKTLQETGELLGLTRERVRQVEAKSIKILSGNSSDLIDMFDSLLSKHELENEYVSFEKISEILGNKDSVVKLGIIFSGANANVSYSFKYKLFYYKNHIAFEELIKTVIDLNSKKIVLKKDFVLGLDYFERKIINDNFKLINDNVYLKKGVSKSDIMLKIIEEEFPNGFRISGEDFDYLAKRVKEIMCDDSIEIKSNALSSLISREEKGFCLINRGTYKLKKFCVTLSDELVSKISDYLLENIPIATYEGIMLEFREELSEIGVRDKYYLKGILDDKLDRDIFITKRDSIIIGDSVISIRKTINNLVENSDVPLTLNDIMKKIPGVKDYTVLQTLGVNDNVLMVDTNKFICVNKILYTDKDVKFLKEQIEKVFELLKTDVIITRKVYARIKLLHSEFFEKFIYIDNFVGFYSFLQYLFRDEYFMRRPYISKNGKANLTRTGLLTEYAKTLDNFDCDDLNDYAIKMNMSGGVFSYLEFMEDLSSAGYIQISKGMMLRQQLFEQKVSKESIEKIDNIVSLMLEKRKLLNTQFFNGYHIFPDVGYKWCKYLLVGILRTYFNNKYDIEYTTNFYDTTDFIVTINKISP